MILRCAECLPHYQVIIPYFRSIISCENSKCLRNKVLKTLGYVRNFTYLSAIKIINKQKSDMTKVAIKNENITSFGGIYHIMDVFSKLGFEKHTESVLGRHRMQRQGIQPWKHPGFSLLQLPLWWGLS